MPGKRLKMTFFMHTRYNFKKIKLDAPRYWHICWICPHHGKCVYLKGK